MIRRTTRPRPALAALAVAAPMLGALLLTGCDLQALGGSYDDAAATPPPAARLAEPVDRTVAAVTSPRTVVAVPAVAPAPAPPVSLRARASAPLGTTLLTVGAGWTLYRSDRDTAAPPTSRCLGACTRHWHPLLVPRAADQSVRAAVAELRLDGIDRRILGLTQRPGGAWQLTVAGWPAYRFAGDRHPGDTLGHCVDGFAAITALGPPAMAVRTW